MDNSHGSDDKPRHRSANEESINNLHALAAASRILFQAHALAADAGRDRWDFAVEIRNLRREGLNESHFRWFVCKRFVEHADEITLLGQEGRSFRPTGELTFTDTTCFVLTPAGVEVATELLQGERSEACVQGEESSHRRKGAPESHEFSLPHWDADRHELSFDGHLVKRFKHKSPNQEMILVAFQEEGWPVSIPDPLSPIGDTDPKRRLNDTIKGLNHHQENQLIHFRGDGTGEGVIWEFVSSSEHA